MYRELKCSDRTPGDSLSRRDNDRNRTRETYVYQVINSHLARERGAKFVFRRVAEKSRVEFEEFVNFPFILL